jgi:hypothetical protein
VSIEEKRLMVSHMDRERSHLQKVRHMREHSETESNMALGDILIVIEQYGSMSGTKEI